MANGYLRIKKTDIYENNGGTYWKNGANIIGNVVKCVDSDDSEHYYIESLKTKKAILLDDDVKIGGGDFGFESTNGNFILVTTDEVDFSDIGGGNGVSITFTFGNKYYTVTLPEDNGDLKIYDPDGEGGETGGGGENLDFDIITETKTISTNVSSYTVIKSLTLPAFLDKIMNNKEVKGKLRHWWYDSLTGEPEDPKTLYYNCCELVHAEYVENDSTYKIAFLTNTTATSFTRKIFTFASDGTLSSIS